MPETVRRTGGRLGSHPRRNGFRFAAAALVIGILTVPARAEGAGLPDFSEYIHALAALNRGEILAMVLTLGVLFFGVVTAILLVRTRIRAGSAESKLRDRIAALRADLDRLQTLLMSDPQVLVSWAAADNEPDILGDTTLITTASVPQRVLSFGSWLEPEKAQAMERAIDALRANGESFSMQLMTLNGRAIEADGRAIGGRAVLRLRDVSGFKRELAELNARHEKLLSEVELLRTLIDALPSPVWARDIAGALTFVNTAYARAVEARDPADALSAGAGTAQPAGARGGQPRPRRRQHLCRPRSRRSSPAARRIFDVLDVPTRRGSAGIGIDATEADGMRSELKRLGDAHRRTLDQLATGVAIFNAEQHLVFYNTAYRSLWELDAGFLDQFPTDSALLDQLRAARKLPEEKDFREWKAALHEAYRATETQRASLAPARRPHAARRHHAQSAGRRDLSVRRRHRAPAAGPRYDALIRVQRRDARQPRRSGRGVRQRRPAAAAQSGLRHDVAADAGGARRAAAHRDRDRAVPPALRQRRALAAAARHRHGDRRPRERQGPARAARRQRGRPGDRAAARRRDAGCASSTSPTRSTSSARCASATRRWKPPTCSRSISSTTCPTSCARRSPTSSASRN